MISNRKVLWVCSVWPEPDSSAAGYRTLELLKFLLEAEFKVHVSSACQRNAYQSALEELGIKTYNYVPNDSSFDIFLKELEPELVFFDRFMLEEQFSWRVKNACPKAKRILDTIDLHFLRRKRAAALQVSESDIKNSSDLTTDCLRELASIYRSDLSLIVSDFEQNLLRRDFQISDSMLLYLPWSYDLSKERKSFEERQHFVWIGNFNHAPNLDSVHFLADQIWPKIRERLAEQKPELHIYGSYQEGKKLVLPEAMFLKGKAKDALQTLGLYKVNLAPLRFGAGLKGKISDGWCAGTPAVSTEIGAEGLLVENKFGGLIANSVEGFANAASQLYSDRESWQEAQLVADNILKLLFCRKTNKAKFFDALEQLIADKILERNVIGEILWLQQFRSTEYMARWIEAKNKYR